MRLALKLILATMIGILAVFAGFGIIREQRELALFDSDMRKDHRLIGSTLGLCVANTWRTSGREDALDLIAQADADRPGLHIGWMFPDGTQSVRAPVLLHDEPPPTSLDHRIRRVPGDDEEEYLLTRIPVTLGAQLLGQIEIAESLSTRNDYLWTSSWNTFVATGLMVLFAGTVVLVLGVWMVGRPLHLVTQKARRIGQGDFSGPLGMRQKDEVGLLAREVDAMCERIVAANERSASAAAARLQAVEQLRHADRLVTVGRLAAGIAHELGTPLNILLARIQMLRRGGLPPETVAEYLDESRGQVNLMTAIIRQLVDFARRREPKAASCDLSSVARSIAKLVEPLARKRGVEVTVTTTEPVQAYADSLQIEQVLSNLVLNALHACAEGGKVELSVGKWTELLPEGMTAPEGAVYLQVADNGSGIAPDALPRIFEPFFTTKEIGQGTGLGLSVVHGIVQDHGGRILVKSELSQGSTFTVVLRAPGVTSGDDVPLSSHRPK